jgi:ATP-dependent RNA helicase DeaD
MGRVGRAGREGVAITLAEPREHRMLKTIERATKRRITLEKVPTVADMRARRLEVTAAALRETLLEDDLDQFRVVAERLADEFDPMDVAVAAVKLAHTATSGADDDESEIPAVEPGEPRPGRPDRARSRPGGEGRDDGSTRLYLSVGRDAKVRPQDLVGAITGETGLRGRQIGSIEIAQKFSLVEVPADAADEVIAALRGAKIRGRRATVRRERY